MSKKSLMPTMSEGPNEIISFAQMSIDPFEPLALTTIRQRLSAVRSASGGALSKDRELVAGRWAKDLFTQVRMASMQWLDPNISEAHGVIAFEWWRGDRQLAIFVDDEGIDYVAASGPHIERDMEHGSVGQQNTEANRLWRWLIAA
jgi:hypothetical protein